jgi:hypothetical protein
MWLHVGLGKPQVGLAYIPPPKARLPGHAESYHPPPEYLPTEVGGRLALTHLTHVYTLVEMNLYSKDWQKVLVQGACCMLHHVRLQG